MSTATTPNERKTSIFSVLTTGYPLIATCILFLGVVRIYVYYKVFAINIIDYVEVGEIVTSFLDSIVYAVMLIVIGLFAMYVFDSFFAKWTDPKSQEPAHMPVTYSNGRTKKFVIPMIIAMTTTTIFLLIRYDYLEYKLSFIFGLWTLSFAMMWGMERIADDSKGYQGNVPRGPILILLASISSILFLSFSESHRVKNRHYFLGTKVVLTDTTLVSDSASYFIGKTKSFVFIYHRRNKFTEAIPIENVKRLEMHTGRSSSIFTTK